MLCLIDSQDVCPSLLQCASLENQVFVLVLSFTIFSRQKWQDDTFAQLLWRKTFFLNNCCVLRRELEIPVNFSQEFFLDHQYFSKLCFRFCSSGPKAFAFDSQHCLKDLGSGDALEVASYAPAFSSIQPFSLHLSLLAFPV